MAMRDTKVKALQILAVSEVFLSILLRRKRAMPVKLSIPWMSATSMTRGLSHWPPRIQMMNQTRLEPKCAYLSEK